MELREHLGLLGRTAGVDTPQARLNGKKYAMMMDHVETWLSTYRDEHGGRFPKSRSHADDSTWEELMDAVINHEPSFFPEARSQELRSPYQENTPSEEAWRKSYYALDFLVEQKVRFLNALHGFCKIRFNF